jgi:hypothetical protein
MWVSYRMKTGRHASGHYLGDGDTLNDGEGSLVTDDRERVNDPLLDSVATVGWHSHRHNLAVAAEEEVSAVGWLDRWKYHAG